MITRASSHFFAEHMDIQQVEELCVAYESLEYWEKDPKITEDTEKLFKKENIIPRSLVFITDKELEVLLKDRSVNTKAYIRELRAKITDIFELKKKIENEIIVQNSISKLKLEKELQIQEELNKNSVRVIKKKNKEETRRRIDLPDFNKNNITVFFGEFDSILKIEEAVDNWFYYLLKAIPWDQGGSLIFEEKAKLENLDWNKGKLAIIEILDPNFQHTWTSKVMKLKPNNETMAHYFIRFSYLVNCHPDVKSVDSFLANIYYESLPEFLKKEIRRKMDTGFKLENFIQINNSIKLIMDKQYDVSIISNVRKNYKQNFHKKNKNKDKREEVKEEKPVIKEKKLKCFKCGDLNHLANQCKKEYECYNCHEKGHIAAKCTKPKLNEMEVIGEEFIEPKFVEMKLNDYVVKGMVDSGASNSFVSKDIFKKIGENIRVLGNTKYCLADDSERKAEYAILPVEFNDKTVNARIHISDINYDFIIGRDLIQYFKIDCSIAEENLKIIKILIEENIEKTSKFSAKIEPLELQFIGNIQKCWVKQYPTPNCNFDIISNQVDDWLNNGIVENSYSDLFNSPLIAINKKDESGSISTNVKRVCIDLSKLNDLLVQDTNDLPLIDDIIAEIGSSLLFSKFDLKSAYTQLVLHENSKDLTSFSWRNRRYRFTRIPFGLKMAPSFFQRKIQQILQKEGLSKFVKNYFDDLIVHSNSIDEHMKHVGCLIKALNEYQLTLHEKKYHAFSYKIEILGSIISQNKVEINFNKIINMLDWPRPVNKKFMGKFIGLLNYFRKYIPNYPDNVEIFSQLLYGSNYRWEWNDNLENQYKKIHQMLSNCFYYSKIDYKSELFLYTDASNVGIGGYLCQKGNGNTKFIAMVARKLKKFEINYSTPKKEILAIIFCLKKFTNYLMGYKFTIFSDNQSLSLNLPSNLNSNWKDILSQFRFSILHINGADNFIADALSRLFRKKPVTQLNTLDLSEMEKREIKNIHALGHFGAESMTQMLKWKGISFPNVKEKCVKFIKKCQICQKWSKSKPHFAPISPVFNNVVWNHISIDLLGPVPPNEEDYNYILVIVDVATRYVVLRPLVNKSATTTAQSLMEIFSDYGFPEKIQSDHGSEFVNSIFTHMKDLLKIDHFLTTPYYAATNGLVERNIQTVSLTLKKLTTDLFGDMSKWPYILPLVQLTMNTKIAGATKFPPACLMFGRNLVNNHVKEEESEVDGEENFDLSENDSEQFEDDSEARIIEKWALIFRDIIPESYKNLKESQQKMKKKVDSSHSRRVNEEKGKEFKKGDIVFYKNIQKTSKWDEEFLGPVMINNCNKRTGNYILVDIDDPENIIANNIPPHFIRLLD